MHQTKNLRVVDTTVLPSPEEMQSEIELSERAAAVVYAARGEIEAVLQRRDRRKLVIVGPCSVHDPVAARDYAERLLRLRERFASELMIVMRVYFEKPRTTVGWKGLINDPHLDGTFDIPAGLRVGRRLLHDLAELGMPCATEMLDPIIPQYLADLISWSAIGARTTESQTHREMASGLSMPVGFKNGTDGSLDVAINAIIAASRPHRFLGLAGSGRVGVVRTAGNSFAHLVLRGGTSGPNYSAADVRRAAEALARAGLSESVLIDCSHDNSGKSHARQVDVAQDIGEQLRAGGEHVLGVMLESNLVAGRQDHKPGARLVYGQSITDACMDFDTTERVLEALARDAASSRGRAAGSAQKLTAPAQAE